MDLPDLSLPDGQDALIEKVAAVNAHTIVVLETGSAVTMPWIGKVSGVVDAWYAGSKGADAVAHVLFGDTNPSAKLPKMSIYDEGLEVWKLVPRNYTFMLGGSSQDLPLVATVSLK